jgi:hypothetical protein
LLDKNHPKRIRVLEKGVDDEGTRVVNDASKNHYEPLRSAFGELVGESALISNCNLIVESVADKILIAGVSTYLNSLKEISPDETLDLNKFTIISAEVSDNIYDLLYLMRGKDIEKPAMMVLMKSNQENKKSNQENNKILEKLDKMEESILDKKFILQITDLEDKVRIPKELKLVEIENLIPIPICIQDINENAIKEVIKGELTVSIFEAIQYCSPSYITRMGFARSIVDIIQEWQRESCVDTVQHDFVHNFKTLFSILNDRRQIAVESLNLSSVKQRVERHIDGFIKDHHIIAKRSDVVRLLKTIKNSLDNSDESNYIKNLIEQIYSNYNLEKDLNKFVDDYKQLIQELKRLPHEGRLKTQISPIPLKDEDFQDQNGIDASFDFSAKSEEEPVLNDNKSPSTQVNQKTTGRRPTRSRTK